MLHSWRYGKEYWSQNIDKLFNIIIKLQEGSDMKSKFDELKREAECYEDALRNTSADDKEEKISMMVLENMWTMNNERWNRIGQESNTLVIDFVLLLVEFQLRFYS